MSQQTAENTYRYVGSNKIHHSCISLESHSLQTACKRQTGETRTTARRSNQLKTLRSEIVINTLEAAAYSEPKRPCSDAHMRARTPVHMLFIPRRAVARRRTRRAAEGCVCVWGGYLNIALLTLFRQYILRFDLS